MFELGIQAEAVIQNMIETHIQELESKVLVMELEKKRDEAYISKLEREFKELKENDNQTKYKSI